MPPENDLQVILIYYYMFVYEYEYFNNLSVESIDNERD